MNEKISKNLIAIAIIVAGLIIAGALVYINQGKISEKTSQILSSQEVGEKTIKYINENILKGQATSTLKEITEESGVYKLTIKIEDREYPSYVTSDGKLLFTQEAINLEKDFSQATTSPEKEYSQEKLEALAKCLAEKGAKFYGAYYCGWCKKQKEIFGKAAQYLPYIECVDEKTKKITPECEKAGISGYPTWEINGQKSSGFKAPEELVQLSGCQW